MRRYLQYHRNLLLFNFACSLPPAAGPATLAYLAHRQQDSPMFWAWTAAALGVLVALLTLTLALTVPRHQRRVQADTDTGYNPRHPGPPRPEGVTAQNLPATQTPPDQHPQPADPSPAPESWRQEHRRGPYRGGIHEIMTPRWDEPGGSIEDTQPEGTGYFIDFSHRETEANWVPREREPHRFPHLETSQHPGRDAPQQHDNRRRNPSELPRTVRYVHREPDSPDNREN